MEILDEGGLLSLSSLALARSRPLVTRMFLLGRVSQRFRVTLGGLTLLLRPDLVSWPQRKCPNGRCRIHGGGGCERTPIDDV